MRKNLKGKNLGKRISQKKDGKYSARFTSRSGKRIEKHFEKAADAKKRLAESKYEDEHGNIGNASQLIKAIKAR